jgi:hypothetical protein
VAKGGEGYCSYARVFFFALLALSITVVAIYYVGLGLSKAPDMPEVQLPLLVIAGVIGLLAAINCVAIAFAAIGISDPNEALGLPKGSIRALIALSLILIFAIMSTFLWWHLDSTNTEKVRFAQQILTTVSTLVVAIAGFYFGTRSAETTPVKEPVETPT